RGTGRGASALGALRRARGGRAVQALGGGPGRRARGRRPARDAGRRAAAAGDSDRASLRVRRRGGGGERRRRAAARPVRHRRGGRRARPRSLVGPGRGRAPRGRGAARRRAHGRRRGGSGSRRVSGRRRPGRAEIALAAVSLLLFLGGAELLARSVDLRPRSAAALRNPPWLGGRWMLRRDYREEMAAEGLLSRYYELYEWDRYLFFRLRPDAHLELVDVMAPEAVRERTRWSVHTNGRGFRTPAFEDRPAAGVLRIVALGDSSTFGWGV